MSCYCTVDTAPRTYGDGYDWIDMSICITDTYRTFSEWSLQAVSAVFHRIAKWPALRGLLPLLSPSPLRQMNWPGEIAGNGKEREGAGY